MASRRNAICDPSGDQDGATSLGESWIRSRRPLPSAFATAMSASFVVVNASSVPSGDHEGGPAAEAS